MVEVTSQDEEGIWMGCLLFTDVVVESIQRLTPVVVGARGNVYGYKQYSTKLTRQVEES